MTAVDNANRGGIDERIFVNEDLSRPENRINVALFGLMAQDWFRTWLLRSLDMPENAIVFPPRLRSPCGGKGRLIAGGLRLDRSGR